MIFLKVYQILKACLITVFENNFLFSIIKKQENMFDNQKLFSVFKKLLLVVFIFIF